MCVEYRARLAVSGSHEEWAPVTRRGSRCDLILGCRLTRVFPQELDDVLELRHVPGIEFHQSSRAPRGWSAPLPPGSGTGQGISFKCSSLTPLSWIGVPLAPPFVRTFRSDLHRPKVRHPRMLISRSRPRFRSSSRLRGLALRMWKKTVPASLSLSPKPRRMPRKVLSR